MEAALPFLGAIVTSAPPIKFAVFPRSRASSAFCASARVRADGEAWRTPAVGGTKSEIYIYHQERPDENAVSELAKRNI